VHTPVRINQTKPASVRKTDEILNVLSKYTQAENGGRFSSSSLTTYISCGLRFYYNYVAGIREQRDEAGSIEADVFGKILHTALENLYGPFKEKEVTSADIDGLLKKSDSAVEEATRKEFGSGTSQLEGNDRILSGALKELVRRILNADKKTTPFELLALEGAYEMYADTGSGKVKLFGIFDRVDRYKGSVRIIDYKTGKVKTSLQKDLEKIFLNPDYKTLFQLFFYAHVYRHNHPNEHILPGFFVAQSLSEGITFADMVSVENADWFNDRLNALLREIMDPAKEFEPTSDAKRCEYCPYRDICHR
jgi:ATP-dependent helicase/DNAse subunit B